MKKTRLKDLTGQRFGKLVVIERSENKKSWTMWKCKCDCGNEKITYATHLTNGNIISCGCMMVSNGKKHVQWKGYGEISGKRWGAIKKGSEKGNRRLRQLDFSITIEFIWDLFIKQNRRCALTGRILTFEPNTASLDRIDNTQGYTENNVQWVHKDINKMKNIFSNEYFIQTGIEIAKKYNYGQSNNAIVGCEI
jgi:hypothetical protein